MHKEEIQNSFKEAVKNMDQPERKAVDTIEGPVSVIAGRGTDKTQIIAAKVSKILLETDALPDNILCLTYSEAGTISIRKRLVNIIGSDANKIKICTLNAFCEEVIQDNILLIEKPAFKLISLFENIQLFKSLIDGFKKDHLLKNYRSNVYAEINKLKELFSIMKREGWSAKYLEQQIAAYLKDLLLRDEYIDNETGNEIVHTDLSTDKIEDEIERMNRLRAAVNEFENYQTLLQASNRYDIEDRINWVIGVFEKNNLLLTNYQKRFQHVLVNDYPETSPTQKKLIQLLTNYSTKPNLFVVGNEDQSEEISAASLQIKKLVLIEYHSVKEEMISVTNAVNELLENNISPEKIAVIYRENKYGNELANIFELKKIPFYKKENINILEQVFIKKLLQLLRYLNAEHDTPSGGDQMLFEILHFDFYTIPTLEIAKLTVEVNSKRYCAAPVSLRKLLYDKANLPPKDLFENGINEELKNISGVIENLMTDVSTTTLAQLFQNIIRNAGVFEYVLNSNDTKSLQQLLIAFTDFIEDETSRNPNLQLKDFVAIIDLMLQEKIPIPMIKIVGNENLVSLLSAEDSMDSLFEYIFIAGLNDAADKKKFPKGTGYKLPGNLLISSQKLNDEEILRRLFCMAINRAEIKLHISYAKFNTVGNEIKPSIFITELVEQQLLAVQKIQLPVDQIAEFDSVHFSKKKPEIQKPDDDFITPLLKKFVMNVSALNTYLHCPLGFYYTNIIRIPSGKSDTLAFGSAVHFALEKLFKKMQDGRENKFSSIEEMMEDFFWIMNRSREYFTQESFDRRMEQGSIIIPAYYETYINSWKTVVAIERIISGVNVHGVPLKGKLDKLEFNGKEINVVDYKTGDIDKALSNMKPPQEKDPNGGDYWRQAVFYKILIDNYTQKDWKVISTEFDFVEPDKNKAYRKERIIITEADTETVKQQIVQVWEKIQNHDFYTGCGKTDCQWCNFVKDNKLAVALHATDE